MVFETNIASVVGADELKSAFKSDKRIWSFHLENKEDKHILIIEGELESPEIVAKINSLGYEATAIPEGMV